jgi:protein-tyrosine sulfotransferase
MSMPIFVLSNFRSGSTLLRYVLDAHPAVCCPAELRLAALCQQLFRVVELTTTGQPTSNADGGPQRVSTVRNIIDQVMDNYCMRKGKERWCEKSPANTEILYVLSTVFPDGHFICLHRHALDQVHSTIDVEPHRLQPYLARHAGDLVAAGIDRWCTITERLLAFEHAHHRRALRTTYESFVDAPERELTRLLQFLDLAAVPGLSVAAFQHEHDRGPRDAKIAGAKAVERDRVGTGRAINLTRVPSSLRERLARLLGSLGYPA